MEKNPVGKLPLYVLYVFLALITLSAAAVFYATELTDSDIWFHLAYGRYFLEHCTLTLDHSIFSWTPADNSTIYCCWVPEIFFYLMNKLLGTSGFYALRYLVILVFLVLSLSFIRRIRIEFIPVVLLILLTSLLMSISGIRVKPEIFSYLLMAVMAWAWFKVKASPDMSPFFCYIFPIVTLIWVNSHGGFIFGMIFLGTVCAGEIINWASGSAEMLARRTRKHFFIAAFLSAVALFITPYGWDYPAYIINSTILHSEQFRQNVMSIMEYQSIFQPGAQSFHFVDYLVLFSCLLILLLIVSWRKFKPDWSLLLANAVFAIIYIKYLRSTYFWAIIAAFSCLYLLQKISKASAEPSPGKYVNYAIQTASICILLFFAARSSYDMYNSSTFGFRINYHSPVVEAEYIRKNFPHIPIGNDYASGAYLLWALGPEQKVFIDARYFPYAGWFSDYAQFEYGKDNASKDSFLRKYTCNLWCLTYEFNSIDYFLKSPDWKLVYYGPSMGIFIPSGTAYPKGREVSDSIYSVPLSQALAITRFALVAGDLDVAARLLMNLEPAPFSKTQKEATLSALLKTSDILFANGKYGDAVKICSKAIGLEPESFSAHFIKGMSEARTGNLEDSIKSLTKATRLKPDSDAAHSELGGALFRAHRMDDAYKEYSTALEINPQNARARKNLSIVQQYREGKKGSYIGSYASITFFKRGNEQAKSGDLDGAIKSYNEALRISPTFGEAHYNLAVVLMLKNRPDEAAKEYAKVLETNPDNTNARKNLAVIQMNRGNAQAQAGDLAGAARSFSEVIRVLPDVDIAHYNLAVVLMRMKKLDGAVKEYKKALEINPNNETARKNLDMVLRSMKQIDIEIARIEQRLMSEPDNRALNQALALCYANKGDYESALAQLKKLLGKAPERPDSYYNIACMYARMGRVDESIKWLDLAIRKGFSDIALLKKDADLDPIRSTAYYRQLIQRY